MLALFSVRQVEASSALEPSEPLRELEPPSPHSYRKKVAPARHAACKGNSRHGDNGLPAFWAEILSRPACRRWSEAHKATSF